MTAKPITRVLVLGGGGVIGVAWESGIAVGLHEAGYDPRTFDAFIGTSAGAFVGSRLAAGRLPQFGSGPRGETKPIVSPSELDLEAVKQIFGAWSEMRESTPERLSAIGRCAGSLYRESEPALIDRMRGEPPLEGWPEKPLLITTVNTASGERRIFGRDDGVELARAIAASTAVPGLFPAVTIGDGLFMDGQVHSSTHADLALRFAPAQVVIVMPTTKLTGQGIGPHAERMAELEIEQLRAGGCSVQLTVPSAENATAFGRNMMDVTKAKRAYEIGLEAGRALAAELS